MILNKILPPMPVDRLNFWSISAVRIAGDAMGSTLVLRGERPRKQGLKSATIALRARYANELLL